MSLSSGQISISQRDLSLTQDMKPEVLQLKTHQTAPVQERVQECRRESRTKTKQPVVPLAFLHSNRTQGYDKTSAIFSLSSKVIRTNLIKEQWRL